MPPSHLKKWSVLLGSLIGFAMVGLPELLETVYYRGLDLFYPLTWYYLSGIGFGLFTVLIFYWRVEINRTELSAIPFLAFYLGFFFFFIFPYQDVFNAHILILSFQMLGILLTTGISWGVWYYLFKITHNWLITKNEKEYSEKNEASDPIQ
ncbi:MAG: hypothetical protein ACXACA_09065 [Candidatus Ranarchaeia archaeon]